MHVKKVYIINYTFFTGQTLHVRMPANLCNEYVTSEKKKNSRMLSYYRNVRLLACPIFKSTKAVDKTNQTIFLTF